MTLLIVTWVPTMYTHKHVNRFLLTYMKGAKEQFLQWLAIHHLRCTHQFNCFCYVLLKRWEYLTILENVENWMWVKNLVKGTMTTKVKVLTKDCILHILHVLIY